MRELQHLVRAVADPGHDVGWREGGLLDLGKIVLGVAVQLEDANLDQRIILVWSDLGQVEWVVGRLIGVGLGHDLDAETPFRIVAALDRLEQIALMGFAVVADEAGRLRVGQVGDALHRLHMKLHPTTLIVGVDKAVGVAAIAVDMGSS